MKYDDSGKLRLSFLKVLKKRGLTPVEAFRTVFDVNGNGEVDALEFVDGLTKLKVECDSFNARRVFDLIDTDGNGVLTLSECIKLFSVEPPKVRPIDEHSVLPAIEREVQGKFGFTVDLEQLAGPIKKSFCLYDAVFRRTEELERADLAELLEYTFTKSDPSVELQDVSELDRLLDHAGRVQEVLKSKLTSDSDGTLWRVKAKFRHLREPFQTGEDPGIKSKKRCVEKAAFKYKAQFGQQRFRRLRDIARISLQFRKCADLLAGVKALSQIFEVIEVDNRMKVPTALGWRDMAVLVRVPVPNTSPTIFHLAEIQLQLSSFAVARQQAHQYYRILREKIPALLGEKAQEQGDHLQTFILEKLQTVNRKEFATSVNVGGDMERSKVWTQPWYTKI